VFPWKATNCGYDGGEKKNCHKEEKKNLVALMLLFSLGAIGTAVTALRLWKVTVVARISGADVGSVRWFVEMTHVVLLSQIECAIIVVCANMPGLAALLKKTKDGTHCRRHHPDHHHHHHRGQYAPPAPRPPPYPAQLAADAGAAAATFVRDGSRGGSKSHAIGGGSRCGGWDIRARS
jgi:ABC-type nickel/cobalt efflux system permease component RcnA